MRKLRNIILALLAALILFYGVSWIPTYDNPDAVWGATFSQYYAAEELGLNWRAAYMDMLNELNPAKLRLIAYWQYIEPRPDELDFTDLDFQIAEAAKRGIPVTLVMGYRVPRWPECHWPGWVKRETPEEFRAEVKGYLTHVVEHYRGQTTIERWQVENEPLFAFFGVCPPPDGEFLNEEIALVKALDPSRPIMLTDSGEFSTWRYIAGRTEIVGTTLYRTVWNQYTGWWTHFLPPSWYAMRERLVKTFKGTERVVIAELQAEPWAAGNRSIVAVPFAEQTERFDLKEFERTIVFARATGLPEIYLWGAEWWYWRKAQGDPTFWDAAKKVFE
ncbi:MAG: endo-1,4-beta-xylanase [Candidatus Brennerbacteria bacterium]